MLRNLRASRGPWTARPRASKISRRLLPAVDRLEERQMLSASGVNTDPNQPTDAEQLFLAEVNRARANPAAEGRRLVALAQTDPVLKVATSGWDMNKFLSVISSIAPEPPLAFNTRLIEAARAQSSAMLAANTQFHSASGYLTNPAVARASDGQAYYPTGSSYWATGENVFAYSGNVNSSNIASYVDYFAAAFLIDWGNPQFGHLYNELAPGPDSWSPGAAHYPYSEIGIGLLTSVKPSTAPGANNQGYNVGPAIVTQEFGWRSGNPILTGTFYNDNNGNGQYDIAEGIGAVIIRAVGRNGQGTFTTTTWNSGGYSLALPAGTYDVTASGGGLSTPATTSVTLNKDNVAWDDAVSSKPAMLPADQPVPGDFNGDGKATLAVYRASNGQWFFEGKPISTAFGGGNGVDIPLPGDYNGDGKTDLALYRSTTSQWFVQGSDGVGRSLGVFGAPGYDIPIPGDYNGDGKTEAALYRPSTGQWFALGADGIGRQFAVFGGANVDIPVPGDYDGVGHTEAAVYRPTTGQWFVYGPNGGHQVAQLGQPGLDIPVPGVYDGNGKMEPAVYRPTTGQWFILANGVVRTFTFGGAGVDVPLRADFDGDGKADPALYRPTTGEWFVYNSSSGQKQIKQLGQGGSSSSISTWLDNYSRTPSPQIAASLVFPQALNAGPALRVAASVPQAETTGATTKSTTTTATVNQPTPVTATTPVALTLKARLARRLRLLRQR